ncbi:unnamed protein product [Choristocarpus tenellus]
MEATVVPNLPHYRMNKAKVRRQRGDFTFFEGVPFFEEARITKRDRAPDHDALVGLRKDSASTSLEVGRGVNPAERSPYNTKGASTAGFVAYSGQVLQFDAYFKEAVDESPLENHRVRKCKILMYLEDSSMQIEEARQENSGMPQGTLVKRHQIPYPETKKGFYTAKDLRVGGIIDVYGRRFHIVDANKATRLLLEQNLGRKEEPAIPFPLDRYSEERKTFMSHETGCDPNINHKIVKNDMKVFTEASLGNTVDNSKREGFLKFDRKVLSFDAVWDDRESLYGDLQSFKVHYFLSDDTIEVRAVHGPNSGRDPFPILLKRGALPKSVARGLHSQPYLWRDLSIGGELNVYERKLVLIDADAHTRQFYSSQGMSLGDPVRPPSDNKPVYEPSGGSLSIYSTDFSDDDGMVSRPGSLIPLPARKVLGEDVMFRYTAELVSEAPEDMGRRFIMSYYKADRTLVVREPPQRNSGVTGGNFLSRMKVRDELGNVITEGRFYVGAEVLINGHCFRVTEADVKTLRLMEERPDAFPNSDLARVTDLVREKIQERNIGNLRARLQEVDTEGNGIVSRSDLRVVLEGLGVCFNQDIPEQVLVTLMRAAGGDANSVLYNPLVDQVQAGGFQQGL